MQLTRTLAAWHPQLLSTFVARMSLHLPSTWAPKLWWFITPLLCTETVAMQRCNFDIRCYTPWQSFPSEMLRDHSTIVGCGVEPDQCRETGKKRAQKIYRRHSGRPGGMTEEMFDNLQKRIPERIVEHAVSGMLPKGRVRWPVSPTLYRLEVAHYKPYWSCSHIISYC